MRLGIVDEWAEGVRGIIHRGKLVEKKDKRNINSSRMMQISEQDRLMNESG